METIASPPLLLGAIADDFTGATDLANTLVRAGMRTVQTIGVPPAGSEFDADAVVVALKSRTNPAAKAVADSLSALAWLQARGARQIYFKYCSTFDSTDAGNIGPVADALQDAIGESLTIICPAFPANGRTIHLGHLFVGDRLLSESSMRDHPLTPMRDSDLVRVMGRQTRRLVALIPYPIVSQGAAAIEGELARMRGRGVRYAVVDALLDQDLHAIGAACRDLKLVTAASGVAMGLPANFVRAGQLPRRTDASVPLPASGPGAVLAGSCSVATRQQVSRMAETCHAVRIDPLDGNDSVTIAQRTFDEVRADIAASRPVLIYSSAEPEAVAVAQHALGKAASAMLIESAFAGIAKLLVANGVRRLVVAGGETSGAVVSALRISALAIGPQIDPGVPWTVSLHEPGIALALKSGNFGAPDFFAKALRMT
jgi:3-dehydrotetronate 4-kinase